MKQRLMRDMLRSERKRRWPWVLLLLLLLIVGGYVLSMATAQLPEVQVPARAAAPAVSVPGLSVCWVEYSHKQTLSIAASAGWPGGLRWHTTTSGLLVRHPRGMVLIDVGVSTRTEEEAESLPFVPRSFIALTGAGHAFEESLPDALKRVGVVDPSALRWLLPTHGHFDHLGGMMELPGVPVLLTDQELAFVRSGPAQRRLVFDEHVKALEGRLERLTLEQRPYEIFSESADLFGDGSVVVVPLPGHTPGHLGVIVNVNPDLRLFYVGDAVSAEAALSQRVPKSFILAYSDEDKAAADKTVSVLSAFHAQAKELMMIPGHDRSPWTRVFGPQPGCIGDTTAPVEPSGDGGVELPDAGTVGG